MDKNSKFKSDIGVLNVGEDVRMRKGERKLIVNRREKIRLCIIIYKIRK